MVNAVVKAVGTHIRTFYPLKGKPMKIEVIKTQNNRYKFISRSNQIHPALVHLAQYLKDANKIPGNVKIGLYNVYGGQFSNFVTVYSYISGRKERMGKARYHKFIKGKIQMKPVPALKKLGKKANEELIKLFGKSKPVATAQGFEIVNAK